MQISDGTATISFSVRPGLTQMQRLYPVKITVSEVRVNSNPFPESWDATITFNVMAEVTFVGVLEELSANETEALNFTFSDDSWIKVKSEIVSFTELAFVTIGWNVGADLVRESLIVAFQMFSDEKPIDFDWELASVSNLGFEF